MTQHSSEGALTTAEFDTLLDTAFELEHPFDAECAFILIAGGRLGMRAGEIAHCRESWVNWDRGIIEIPRFDPCDKGEDGGVCGSCYQSAIQVLEYNPDRDLETVLSRRWNPKTENSARAIPFDWNDEAETVIGVFFGEFDRYPSSRSSINRRVDRVLEAAGYPTSKAFPHALRATAATHLAYQGVSAVALQSMFGWSSINTARKYIRLSGGATQKALHDAFAD